MARTPRDSPHVRLGVLGIVAVSLFAALFARLWYLQVMAAPTLQVKAQSNRERVVPIAPLRGRILDRAGRVLADNRLSNVVEIDRAVLRTKTQRDALFATLAPVINTPVADMNQRFNDSKYSPLLPLPVAEDVNADIVVYLQERADQYPGVEAKQVAVREYPFGTLAAHVVGYTGLINDTEYGQLKGQGYALDEDIGKEGVEKIYEKDLRGTPGSMTLEVDSKGRVLRELNRVAPVPGKDVQLTIDLRVQALTEQSLQEGLIAARQRTPKDVPVNYAAPAGSAVVLDPRDGSVVAMASYPTFDPREFVSGISAARYKELLDPAQQFPLNNRAIQGQYAPGSTFKLVTATAGLASGIINAGTVMNDTGTYKVPDCTEQCDYANAGKEAHGLVAVTRAISVSSDVFFYSIGADLWRFRQQYGLAIQQEAQAYGFGAQTGVPLPGEATGRVPTPDSKQALHDANPTAFPFGEWFTGDNVNLAIGQGEMLVTPLQLANAYAAFANGGTVYSPNIVLRTLAPGSSDTSNPVVDRVIGPRVLQSVPLPASVRDPIMQGLIGAVDTKEGTAYPAFENFPLNKLPVAGKTGTAQTAGLQAQTDTSLFVAFGPAPSARYVVVAVLEQAGFGAQAAAPVVRRVFDGLAGNIALPDVKPAPPVGSTAPPPGTSTATTSTLPPIDLPNSDIQD